MTVRRNGLTQKCCRRSTYNCRLSKYLQKSKFIATRIMTNESWKIRCLVCENFPPDFVTQALVDDFISLHGSSKNYRLLKTISGFASRASSTFYAAQCEIVRLDHQKPTKRFHKWALCETRKCYFLYVLFHYVQPLQLTDSTNIQAATTHTQKCINISPYIKRFLWSLAVCRS